MTHDYCYRPNHRTQSTPSLPRLAGAANGSDTTPPATSSRQTSAPKNAVAAVSYVSHVLNGNTQQQKVCLQCLRCDEIHVNCIEKSLRMNFTLKYVSHRERFVSTLSHFVN